MPPLFSRNSQIIKIMNNNNQVLFDATNVDNKIISAFTPFYFKSNGNNLTNYEIYGNDNGVGNYDSLTQKYLIPIKITGESTSQTITLSLDAALMEGQKITLTDTNINIPTYNGRNIITIETETQPAMILIKGQISFIGIETKSIYTINYYSQDGQTLLYSEKVASGNNGTFSGTPTKANTAQYNYTFVGWASSANSTAATSGCTENITQNTNLYAAFSKTFKTDTISDSWEDIITACDNGTYSSKYQIGDLKTIDVGTEGQVQMQIVAIDTDELADSNNTAPITWISKQLLNTSHRMNPAYSSGTEGTGTLGGWEKTEMRSYLKETVKPLIPEIIRNAIKPVKKYTSMFNASGSFVRNAMTTDDIWIPSYREVYSATGYEELGSSYLTTTFSNYASRIKNKTGGSATSWWLRTGPQIDKFCDIYADGSISYKGSSYQYGIALGFCT